MLLTSQTRIIAKPIGEVWAVTSSFGAITAWMPSVLEVSVEGAGIGAVRSVVTSNGPATERLTLLDPVGHRVRYAISAPGLDQITGLVGGTNLTAIDAATTKVEWLAEVDSVEGDVTPIAGFFAAFMAESLGGLAAFLNAEIREA